MRYRLAIFDFDGTLSDSMPWFRSVADEVADRFGFRKVGPDEAEAMRHLGARETLKRAGVPMWRLPAVAAHVKAMKACAAIPLFDGAAEMLEALASRGMPLAMISSDSETGIRAALGPKVTGCFSHWDCNASLLGKAPKIRKAVKAFRLEPREAIYIGDELRDAEAAAQAGVDFGAVSWGYAATAALQAADPAELFMTLSDVLRIAS
jgi:phosphoglycolate phosphatase